MVATVEHATARAPSGDPMATMVFGEKIASEADRNEQFASFQTDAPACDNCGAITVRHGNCYLCHNCGSSMGCS